MSSMVKVKNPKTGITYVYESESYWDKDLKQPRNHRKLVGKLNEKGEIVPTGKKGRPKSSSTDKAIDAGEAAKLREEAQTYAARCSELEYENRRLKRKLSTLQAEKEEAGAQVRRFLQKYYE